MPPEEKKLTQSEVNALLARERKDHAKEISDRDTIVEAAKARIAELESLTTTLTGERDTARAELEGTTTQHAALQAQHDGALGEHRKFRAELSVTQALVAAKVLPVATKHATHFLMREAQIETDAQGTVIAATYRGKRYDALNEAAVAFLKDNDHLASGGRPVGSGAKQPNAVGPSHTPDPLKQDPRDLATEGWNEPPAAS